MKIPAYKTPLPKGASKEVINLSKEVNKWANLEATLLFQVCDLEEMEQNVGPNPTFRNLLRAKQLALERAEINYKNALHKMCEAM